jgi:hypothetical protein
MSIGRLNACDLIYVFVIFNLCLFICIIHSVKESLINGSLIKDNRILLVKPIIYHISYYYLLSVRREEVIHNSPNKRRRDVLLNDHAFIHAIGEVIHSPTTGLFRLISKHSNTFSLCVIAKGTQ